MVQIREAPADAVPIATGAAQAAAQRPDAQAIGRLSLTAITARLQPDRIGGALALLEWLSSPSQRESVGSIVAELCERFLRAGVPLDRYGSSTTMVTAETDAVGRIWTRGRDSVEETVYVSPEEQDPAYLASPFYEASRTGAWVDLWLPETPDSRFGIVPTLKAAGYVHYFCIPFRLTNGANGWVTFATRRATGFSEQDALVIAFAMPALTGRIDARVGWLSLDKLLRTYVGDEPHHAILAGRAKRGQVTTITAAMLVADLRDSTGQMADLGALKAVDLFNDLFDCLVPGIERRQGEVLKYLGDGLLAIFTDEVGGREAAAHALGAAEEALELVQEVTARHPERRPMEIGIALHYGQVAYGNVGSGARLDFTVIGRDVALATRVAGMNGPMGRPLLMTAAFVRLLANPAERLGAFPARGFAELLDVYAPAGAGKGTTA